MKILDIFGILYSKQFKVDDLVEVASDVPKTAVRNRKIFEDREVSCLPYIDEQVCSVSKICGGGWVEIECQCQPNGNAIYTYEVYEIRKKYLTLLKN